MSTKEIYIKILIFNNIISSNIIYFSNNWICSISIMNKEN